MLTKEESIIHDRIFINELAATLEDKTLVGLESIMQKLTWCY
jgi:hypothetical protein